MRRKDNSRERSKNQLERKEGVRPSHDRVLIVREGEKTEPEYFEEFRKRYRLSATHIKITQSAEGNTPQQVIDNAWNELNKKKEWERVYCVFDRDDHHNFNNALKSAKAHNNRNLKTENGEKIKFIAIPSVPCFELWFLLHFNSFTKEMHRDKVIKELRKPNREPKYNKSGVDFFKNNHDKRWEAAFKNAQKLNNNRTETSIENPYTAVGDLVKYLIELGGKVVA